MIQKTAEVGATGADAPPGIAELALPGGSRCHVQGVVLEAAFSLDDGRFLVWLTEGDPYDERLHIHLLTADGDTLDSIASSATFTPGILQIGTIETCAINFDFYNNETHYRLIVGRPTLRLTLPRGWRFAGWRLRHLLSVDISEVP